MPQKTFEFTRRAEANVPLALPDEATPELALERVLRLPGVGSKRFLTTKVDRCVTGGDSVAPAIVQALSRYRSVANPSEQVLYRLGSLHGKHPLGTISYH